MNVRELETAKRLGLPLVVLVWTDGSYGLIEMHQRRRFGHVRGTRFGNPDFVALAARVRLRGLPCRARRRPRRRSCAQAFAAPGPSIVDIPIDYSENEKLGIDLWSWRPTLSAVTIGHARGIPTSTPRAGSSPARR